MPDADFADLAPAEPAPDGAREGASPRPESPDSYMIGKPKNKTKAREAILVLRQV